MILLLLATLQAAIPQDAGLKRLAEPAKHLDAGMKAFLGGKDAVEAFKPWDYFVPKAAEQAALREALKKGEVASASCFALELRLQLLKKGAPLGSLEFIVRVAPEPDLLRIRYRKAPGEGAGLDKCTGPAQPFAAAAKDLFEKFKAGKTDGLRFAPKEAIEKALPVGDRKDWTDKLEKSRAELPALTAQIAALGADEVHISADEQWFQALKADGSPAPGTIRGNLKLSDAGKLVFYLDRFDTK